MVFKSHKIFYYFQFMLLGMALLFSVVSFLAFYYEDMPLYEVLTSSSLLISLFIFQLYLSYKFNFTITIDKEGLIFKRKFLFFDKNIENLYFKDILKANIGYMGMTILLKEKKQFSLTGHKTIGPIKMLYSDNVPGPYDRTYTLKVLNVLKDQINKKVGFED